MKTFWNILLFLSLIPIFGMWLFSDEGVAQMEVARWSTYSWLALFVIGRIVISRSNKKRKILDQELADKNKSVAEKRETDKRDAYSIAEQEIETDSKDESLWKKAFVDAGGDEGKQKALYLT
jgi:hypothetical protein